MKELEDAVKNPVTNRRIQNWMILCKIEKCPICSFKTKWIIPRPNETEGGIQKWLNPEFAFHMSSTHGVPPEILIENIISLLSQ